MAESFSYDQLIASGEGRLFTPESGRLPLPPMLMFDRITHIASDDGPHGLDVGRVVGAGHGTDAGRDRHRAATRDVALIVAEPTTRVPS